MISLHWQEISLENELQGGRSGTASEEVIVVACGQGMTIIELGCCSSRWREVDGFGLCLEIEVVGFVSDSE